MTSITYRFHRRADEVVEVALAFDPHNHLLVLDDETAPDWTRLDFQRCPNCNLPDEAGHCPAARGIAHFLPAFEDRLSFEKAVVEVETAERRIVTKTEFQKSLASLIGLVMASSGCPRTRFLRPMARHHLPFASEPETVLRALSLHLLAQYVAGKVNGREIPPNLDRLVESYRQLNVVNSAITERLRAAVKRDAALNGLIILDVFAMLGSDNAEGMFDDIRDYFTVETGDFSDWVD